MFGPAIAAVLEGLSAFPGDVEVHVMSITQKPLAAPFQLAKNIFYHSLVVSKLGWLRTGYQGCIRAVRAKVKTLNLDLVHGEGTERDCALEAVFSGRPNLLTLHGNMRGVARALHARPFSYYWFQSWLEVLALRRTRLVLCNSSYTENWVRPLNHNVRRLPNAVRKSFFLDHRSPRAVAGEGLRFLVIGLISPYKQPLEILRMLLQWRIRGAPDFTCLWVGSFSGETNYIEEFAQEMARAQAAGWARHQPSMNEAELREAMDGSDVLLHIPKEEAFGLVVVEAMLRGMNIVAGRTGGIADFQQIYPGIQLVSPNAPEDWMKALSRFAQNRPRRIPRESWDAMRFHPKEIARHHLEAYRTLVPCPR
jgi:glycosyltransferase involved in cell wall biosynthesis